jgi:hypothetical protein
VRLTVFGGFLQALFYYRSSRQSGHPQLRPATQAPSFAPIIELFQLNLLLGAMLRRDGRFGVDIIELEFYFHLP